MSPSQERPPALVVLEDGTVLRGRSFGAPGESIGEVVFNTSHTGYQEILTDPSYRGQVVLMTAVEIGNYGVNDEDEESVRPWLAGFIARSASRRASNFRSLASLPDYLREKGVVAVEEVDTRALTVKIRDQGALKALLTTEVDTPLETLRERVAKAPPLEGRDLVREVVGEGIERWTRGFVSPFSPELPPPSPGKPLRLALLDCGVKRSILRSLVQVGFEVFRVPYGTPLEEIRNLAPQALFLSNGPGDPEPLAQAAETARAFAGKIPILGICLGHQVLALALGGRTYKMKFGHHGGNQPVQDLETGRVWITAQNHSFAVDLSGAPDLEVTQINLNDQTVEGMRHKSLPIWSVQFHPEAGPGPHDALHLFGWFRERAASAS